MAAYHHYEVASAVVQIGIVLASASIITGFGLLAVLGGGLGLLGIFFSIVAFAAPMWFHLFSQRELHKRLRFSQLFWLIFKPVVARTRRDVKPESEANGPSRAKA